MNILNKKKDIQNILMYLNYLLIGKNFIYTKPIFIPINPLIKIHKIQKQDQHFSNKIKILDTSKGDVIDYNVLSKEMHRLKCNNCGFLYEGMNLITRCPICGSKTFDDTYDDILL